MTCKSCEERRRRIKEAAQRLAQRLRGKPPQKPKATV
jgi:hypothetical protein